MKLWKAPLLGTMIWVAALGQGCDQRGDTNKLGTVVLPITVKDATVKKVRSGTTWVMHAQASDADTKVLINGLKLHGLHYDPTRGDISDLLPYFPESIGTNDVTQMFAGEVGRGFLKLFLTKSGAMVLILEQL